MEQMEPELNRLIAGAKAGDPDAAVRLIDLNYRRIYAFLRRLTQSDEDAADLTQRTFARVWQALPSFEGRSSVSSWMHGIAYHIYVDLRRRDHRMESQSDAWWQMRPSVDLAPDEALSEKDLRATIYGFVEKLEPEVRDTVHLHYYQGLTLEESAHALAVASSTVKYRLRKALDQLKAFLRTQETPNQYERVYESYRTRH